MAVQYAIGRYRQRRASTRSPVAAVHEPLYRARCTVPVVPCPLYRLDQREGPRFDGEGCVDETDMGVGLGEIAPLGSVAGVDILGE